MNFSSCKKKFKQISRRLSKSNNEPTKIHGILENNSEKSNWKPQFFAYRILGNIMNPVLPIFKDLDTNLQKSGLMMGFKPYVSMALLTSLTISISAMLLILPSLYIILKMTFLPSFLFGLGGSLAAGVLTIIIFYSYPLYRADKIKRNLDSNMAFSASFMAILAGAGVSPGNLFQSLARVPHKLAIIDESRIITRDVELLGADIITALEQASKRTKSERFKELLEGFVATIHSGGDLMSYLMDKSQQSMRLKRIALRKFSDNLGVISEFYVTLLVAGPLIFVVLLSVMAMLGGAGGGVFNPFLLLMLLTYIGIPVGSVIFIIVLDALLPR